MNTEKSPSYTERALAKIADVIVKRMEELQGQSWQQPWFNSSYQGVPQNITGRQYNGMNELILDFFTAYKGHELPVFLTFNQAHKEGIHINKGSSSIPVLYYERTFKDNNGNVVPENVVKTMSKEEQEQLTTRAILRKFDVFNIDDTNFKEVKPELYETLKSQYNPQAVKDTEGMYTNKAIDRMFDKNEWLCPIEIKPSDSAFYRPSTDTITLPLKAQFLKDKTPEEIYRNGMEFYSTAIHEMTHSTGTPERLNREKGRQFGDNAYAKEELVAELTAALVGRSLGFDRQVSDNSAKYMNFWVKALKSEPKFVLNLLSEVNKASSIIMKEIEKQKLEIAQETTLSTTPEHRNIPVWEALEKERGKTGDFTYHSTAEEYGKTLLAGVEDILPHIKGKITLDKWGTESLSAEINGYKRPFETRYIPSSLSSWIEASSKECSHSHMESVFTGRNVDIVAAYLYSGILSADKNLRIEMDYSTGNQHWGNFDDVKKAKENGKISNEEYAAFWALESSMGISPKDLPKTATAFLRNHLYKCEDLGIDYLEGSKEAISLLESGKVSARYIAQKEHRTITNSTLFKQLNGEYMVRGKINGVDTGSLPISKQDAISYLSLLDTSKKEQFLDNLVLSTFSNKTVPPPSRTLSPKR